MKNITINDKTNENEMNLIIIHLIFFYQKFKRLSKSIIDLIELYNTFNEEKKLMEDMKYMKDVNETNYFTFENKDNNDIFKRTNVILDIDGNIISSIYVLDNKNFDSIFQLKEKLDVQITESEKDGDFKEVYNKYAVGNNEIDYLKISDGGFYSEYPYEPIQVNSFDGGFYPEYPYQPIQVNRSTAIYRFILPVIVFKAFRIILYKKLLKQNKNPFVFKNILTDISLSFALIIALNLMGLTKIASLLFSDLLISIVLIYIVLYMYDCADEKKKEVNINNIINTLILAPFFVMYVK